MFGEAFMQRALTAGSIIAAACAYLGIFVIWRRIVFLSVALSEVAALGVAIGFFFGQTSFLMAFLLTTVVTLIFWQLWHQQRGFGEAAVGFIYALCAAASVLLVAKNPLAEARGLDLVSGNILYISTPELLVLSLVSLAVVGSQIVFRKEFVAVTFDRDFALSLGLPAGFWDLIFYLSLGALIGLAMRSCGLLFVFASLVIPPMAGLWATRRIHLSTLIAVLVAVFCVSAGLAVSWRFDLPAGPTIVALYSLAALLAVLAGRR